jgi:alpha-L-fucosidase 2
MKIIMSIKLKFIPTLLFLGVFVLLPVQAYYDVSLYDVEWNSPSKDFTESMPIGNGDIGLNVWVEPNGDLLFLIGKTDAFDENSTLLKLGRIRVRFTPNPFSNDTFFRQTLHLDRSEITIDQGGWLSIRIWVDANYPVIHIETNSENLFHQEVVLETWRDSLYTMNETQVSDLFKNLSGDDPYPTYVFPDRYETSDAALLWYHHNHKPDNDGYEINLKLQGLGHMLSTQKHPLQNCIFGAVMKGDNFTPAHEKMLVPIEESNVYKFSIFALTRHPATVSEWKQDLNDLIETYRNKSEKELWMKHLDWWSDFWKRSYLHITGANGKFDSDAYQVTRAYTLSRYMNACAGRGSLPIKFNGSIFSYGRKDDPDYRRWGGPGFWFQNQRLIYWPMLAQGDFDLMQPWFNMYRDMLPLQQERTRVFFNHDGAFFPETITFWGAEVSGHYGWTPFEERRSPLAQSTYVTFYWQNGIEQMLMMYDYFAYTQDTVFAKTVLLPHADAVTGFYEQHYRLDNHGKIHFGPAQSLETYHVAVNPLPEIAGLQYTLNKLLSLPESLTSETLRTRWTCLLEHLPPIPMHEENGIEFLVPAQMWDMKKNIENPELYAVFPYRLYGVGKDSIDIARNTFMRRIYKGDYCWYQNSVQAALLGLVDTTIHFVINRTTPANYSESRFPAMWNAFNDWIPDIDHGGNLQLALHFMLLQCEGSEIRLLPSWPTNWDVSFKLHAPNNTIIECIYRNGRIEYLNVNPEYRQADIIIEPL